MGQNLEKNTKKFHRAESIAPISTDQGQRWYESNR